MHLEQHVLSHSLSTKQFCFLSNENGITHVHSIPLLILVPGINEIETQLNRQFLKYATKIKWKN